MICDPRSIGRCHAGIAVNTNSHAVSIMTGSPRVERSEHFSHRPLGASPSHHIPAMEVIWQTDRNDLCGWLAYCTRLPQETFAALALVRSARLSGLLMQATSDDWIVLLGVSYSEIALP
jgi:hypothetical protein